ncbi:putative receptor protein kinase ZmPK1 [Camellia lanceoleosa]|uniref:Receptor protein kinase ZmPK1 n=1 Tax=Camellia lanceoleosa TaxID=1840588 RepID=A0ACC0FA56_9ERIC|nr:putative receptor protein kinase ZmPK1 [Camellia lanceoleosa]
MSEGLSLSVENPYNVLITPNGVFSAGFHSVGFNAYCFAIFYREPLYDGSHTTVWMANRDQPINGRLSKLTLLKNGNLILTDAGRLNVWATNTESISSVQLLLNDTGNLLLLTSEGLILWQSFQSPTDTLLPNQPLTRNTKLVSSRSQTNYSSSFYKLFFDEENVLSLVYDGLEVSAIADFGIGIQRRLTMDHDGKIRMYSLDEKNKIWNVTWQAKSQLCNIHSICGPNSLCTYVPHEKSGRRCSCIPGYKIKNETDQSLGCEPDFSLSFNDSEIGFLHLPHVEFYGYDDNRVCENYTHKSCANKCLQSCNCYGFQYTFNLDRGFYNCYHKTLLFNGYRSPSFQDYMYIKLPKASIRFYENHVQGFNSNFSQPLSLQLNKSYKKPKENGTLQLMVWFASAIGRVEIICICLVLYLLHRNRQNSSATTRSYFQVATGFRKFTYDELKKATRNFGEEIGRGSGGVVYKGVLSNRRVATIKRLNEAKQGEDEFLAEVSTIGRVNHMNLIEVFTPLTIQGRWNKGAFTPLNENVSKKLWLEEIIDPMMKDRYDASKMEILVEVALQCVDEDKDARPTMSQVVERLLCCEASNY